MVLNLNIFAVVFLYLLSFPAQTATDESEKMDMVFESTITNISWYPVTTSESEAKYCIFMQTVDSDEGRILLISAKKDEIDTKSVTPKKTTKDFSSVDKYLQILFCACEGSEGEEKNCKANSNSKISYLPPQQLYTHSCVSCVDFDKKIKLDGEFRVITKYVQDPFRYCFLITTLFNVEEYDDDAKATAKTDNFEVKQIFKVNEEKFENTEKSTVSPKFIGGVYITSGGSCVKVYENVTKLEFEYKNSDTELAKFNISTHPYGRYNSKMFFNFTETKTKQIANIFGHVEGVTKSTVVGKDGECNYTSPISCIVKEETYCFVKDMDPDDCTPEKAYCAQYNCKNGGKCKSFGNIPSCECPAGYFGAVCDRVECEGGCNNGLCTQFGVCSCHSGWSGPNCSIRNCSVNVCNGEECVQNMNEFKCNCNPLTSTGHRCEHKCDPFCSNGTCSLSGGSTTCLCHDEDNLSECVNEGEQSFQMQRMSESHTKTMSIVCVTIVVLVVVIMAVIIILKKFKSGDDN